jgi:hypothetical protein
MKLKYTIILFAAFILSCSSDQSNAELDKIESVADVISALEVEKQSFLINPELDTVIYGKKGTGIYLPANCFESINGNIIKGIINIEIKECYSVADFIGESLTTVSNGKLLETGGMLNISAESNGKGLQIKKGSSFAIYFPKKGGQTDMGTFYGIQDEKGEVTWVPDYQEKVSPSISDSISDNSESTNNLNDPMYSSKIQLGLRSSTFSYLLFDKSDLTIGEYLVQNNDFEEEAKYMLKNNTSDFEFKFMFDSKGKIIKPKIEKSVTKEIDKKFVDYFLNLPPFRLTGYDPSLVDTIYCPDLTWCNLMLGIQARSIYDREGYKKKFKEKYSKFRNQAIDQVDDIELNNYVQVATKLGWINCDKFWDTEDEKIDFFVNTENSKNTKMYLIFKDIKSIMTGYYQEGKIVFNNIPKGRKVKLIGVSFEGDQPTMSTAETVITKKDFKLDNYQTFSLSSLENELNKLN